MISMFQRIHPASECEDCSVFGTEVYCTMNCSSAKLMLHKPTKPRRVHTLLDLANRDHSSDPRNMVEGEAP